MAEKFRIYFQHGKMNQCGSSKIPRVEGAFGVLVMAGLRSRKDSKYWNAYLGLNGCLVGKIHMDSLQEDKCLIVQIRTSYFWPTWHNRDWIYSPTWNNHKTRQKIWNSFCDIRHQAMKDSDLWDTENKLGEPCNFRGHFTEGVWIAKST